MAVLRRFLSWLRREIRLRRLHREVEARQRVWLATRLTEKHQNEFVRHKKSSLAALEYMAASEAYSDERNNCEF